MKWTLIYGYVSFGMGTLFLVGLIGFTWVTLRKICNCPFQWVCQFWLIGALFWLGLQSEQIVSVLLEPIPGCPVSSPIVFANPTFILMSYCPNVSIVILLWLCWQYKGWARSRGVVQYMMSNYHNTHWVEFYHRSCFSAPVFVAVNCITFDTVSQLSEYDADLFFVMGRCFICHHALHRSKACPQRGYGIWFCKCLLDDPHCE
jgi:hypothetical protein